MEARAASAAAAHRRVKRAMGLLREAARALAPELGDLDVVAELHLGPGESEDKLVQAIRLARHRHAGALDVVILAAPAPLPSTRDK